MTSISPASPSLERFAKIPDVTGFAAAPPLLSTSACGSTTWTDWNRKMRSTEAAKIPDERTSQANGATEEEIEFLLERRVELNALPSDRLVAFIERKLKQHGVRKIIPDPETLAEAYRLQARGLHFEETIRKMMGEEETDNIDVPDDLNEQVAARLREHPEELMGRSGPGDRR